MAEAKKPPKSNTTRVTSPRKTNPNPIKLNRSVSFSSDPVFKVPAQPPLFSSGRLSASRSSSRLPPFEVTTAASTASTESPCPNCQFQRQDWRSQSLMDLQKQPRSRSNSLVRLAGGGGGGGPPTTSSARGCDPTSLSSSNNNNNANTATIFSNNLRSNSWRNLSLIGGHSGGQTNHDHSGQPTIPGAHH